MWKVAPKSKHSCKPRHTEPMIYSSFSLFCLCLQSVLPRTSSGTDDPMAQILGNIAVYCKACCPWPPRQTPCCAAIPCSCRRASLHVSLLHVSSPLSLGRECHDSTCPISGLSFFLHSPLLLLIPSVWCRMEVPESLSNFYALLLGSYSVKSTLL